ncbi:MAG: signal peptidase I [Chloroflexota bacterium]
MAGTAVLGGGIAFGMAHLRAQPVLSGSMRPTVSPGDLAITEPVPIGSLRVGDVIAFTPPGAVRPVLHRIASLDGGVITTKGDANTVADPWHLTAQGGPAYRLVFAVPYLGWLPQMRVALLIGAGLIAVLIALLEVRKGVGARRAQAAS